MRLPPPCQDVIVQIVGSPVYLARRLTGYQYLHAIEGLPQSFIVENQYYGQV